mmetsp:Transcript_16951/g.26100  ORF Transcript_16951/g.26100 Transcript_16951/m.26100 type:complete len:133 (+) Transcript_16951:151-549(+)
MHREVSFLVNQYIQMHREKGKVNFQMADCTFGGGGHTIKLLQQHTKNLRILGTDADLEIVEQGTYAYQDFIKRGKLGLVHSNYVHLPDLNLKKVFRGKVQPKPKFDIVLMDLGFSSFQLEDDERGFSYISDD